jgi:hypothetical protein
MTCGAQRDEGIYSPAWTPEESAYPGVNERREVDGDLVIDR